MANFCSHCGHPVKPTDKFCGFCGAPIANSQPVNPQPAPAAEQQTAKPQPAPAAEQQTAESQAAPGAGQKADNPQPASTVEQKTSPAAAQKTENPQPQQAKVTPQKQVPLYRPEALHQAGAGGQTAPRQQDPNPQTYQQPPYQQAGYQQTPPPYGQAGPGQVPPYQQGQNGGFGVPPYQPVEGSFIDKVKADFTTVGRLNRKRFWVRSLIAGFVSSVFSALCASDSTLLILIDLVVFVAASVYGVMIDIRRCHDLGKPGTYLLFLFVPFFNIYVGIKILFFEGDRGPNQYGPDPLLREGLW
jgi:uncharacterized membrane protein YhaH (DUF805 family)